MRPSSLTSCLILALILASPAFPGQSQDDGSAEMPAIEQSSQEIGTPADSGVLALQLDAIMGEIQRQVGELKKQALGGRTEGMGEARLALEELRDRLAILLPQREEAKKQSSEPRMRLETKVTAALSDLRSALTLYSVEHDGDSPKTLDALVPDYLKAIPSLLLPDHGGPGGVRVLTKVEEAAALDPQMKDTGDWLYIGDPASPLWGSLLIDCSHKNSKGLEWNKL